MKRIVVGVIAGVILGLSMMVGVPELAMADGTSASNLCDDKIFKEQHKELWEAAGCHEPDDEAGRNKTIFGPAKIMIEVALGVIGIAGVLVIIYGGIIYSTSTGDAAKVNKAKNIIIYGVLGLVVAGLAYIIVEFVTRSISG